MLITSSGDKRRPNNVSDVRPSSCHLREYSAYRVGSRCSLCLLLYYLFLILQHYCPCSVIVSYFARETGCRCRDRPPRSPKTDFVKWPYSLANSPRQRTRRPGAGGVELDEK
ncbi:hypothetical protein MRX96_027345 [Rhipicephalus microplus]